ncbi:MAG: hypothetical protein GY855_05975 [candidate division Zixibacteria bacterium]|nr:hypothetical protein [candidate division Zixibacteria bacterium]
MNIFGYRFRILLSALLIALAMSVSVSATRFISTGAYNFQEDEKLNDDLIMTGESVKISGIITGDLIAVCRSAVINGDVNGSMLCADQFTKVFGNIGGSMRIFCQDAQLNGRVKRNVLAFCGSFNFGPEGRVGQDINAYGGEIVIEGRIGNDLIIEATEVIISGTIEGNTEISSDNITLLPTAVIKGNFDYKGARQAKIEDGATVLGTTNWNKVDNNGEKKPEKTKWIKSFTTVSFLILIASSIVHFMGLLTYAYIGGESIITVIVFAFAIYLAIVVLIALSKNRSRISVNMLHSSPLAGFFIGIVAFLAVPIAAIICMVTHVGIPIGLLLIFAFGLLSVAGCLIGILSIGDLILKRFKKGEDRSLYISAFVGVLTIVILSGIPVFGTFLAFVVTFLGIGALILTIYRNKGRE